jgi:hypothetical protein
MREFHRRRAESLNLPKISTVEFKWRDIGVSDQSGFIFRELLSIRSPGGCGGLEEVGIPGRA